MAALLGAPGLIGGLSSTIAAAGIASLALGAIITIFFVQPATNAALFVPSNQQNSFGGYKITGSCPIPNAEIICGSLGSPNDKYCPGGHGSNSYWRGQGEPVCRWALPSSDWPRCQHNNISGNVCQSNSTSSCTVYGYAADFSYPNHQANQPVFYPYLEGKQLEWTTVWTQAFEPGAGAGAVLRATSGNTVYEIYLMHLSAIPVPGKSGDVAGLLSSEVGLPHAHFELKINGEFVRPDSLCGSSTIISP
jgi:hypothetical protein